MSGQKERPEGFVEKIWSFVPTFGTVSTEMKHTQLNYMSLRATLRFGLTLFFNR